MLKFFRALSVAEGISYLMILSISLGLVSRDYVSMVGMLHGILFILYIMVLLTVSEKASWSVRARGGLFIASVIPFAFVGVELFLRKQAVKQSLAVS